MVSAAFLTSGALEKQGFNSRFWYLRVYSGLYNYIGLWFLCHSHASVCCYWLSLRLFFPPKQCTFPKTLPTFRLLVMKSALLCFGRGRALLYLCLNHCLSHVVFMSFMCTCVFTTVLKGSVETEITVCWHFFFATIHFIHEAQFDSEVICPNRKRTVCDRTYFVRAAAVHTSRSN